MAKNFFTQISDNFSFTSWTSNDDLNIWKMYPFLSKIVSSLKKQLLDKAENFRYKFYLNQRYKLLLTQNH